MTSDANRLAKASRLLRRSAGLRQADLPTSRFVTQEIEAGRAGGLKLDRVAAHFATLGATAHVNVWWNGAALDRLIDLAHAQVVEVAASVLTSSGFRVRTEYTFNEYGDRGSIDIFGGHDLARAVFVGEAKSEWGSLEETLRRQDLKVRLAAKLAQDAFGWRAQLVANVLLFPDLSTNRRVVERHKATLSGYPARGRQIRDWLRNPAEPIAGIWFLSHAGLGGHGFPEGAHPGVTRSTG